MYDADKNRKIQGYQLLKAIPAGKACMPRM
jgi:hypothetical protein